MIPVILWTDAFVYIMLFCLVFFIVRLKKTEAGRSFQTQVLRASRHRVALVILLFFGLIGVLDSLHFKENQNNHSVTSVLDVLFRPYSTQSEKTYSAPFATHAYTPEVIKTVTGTIDFVYPKLEYAGQHLKDPQEKFEDILWRALAGLGVGLFLTGFFYALLSYYRPKYALGRAVWLTLLLLFTLISMSAFYYGEYHIFGTDKVGRDVFYLAMKSIRTGLVIGTVSTLVMLPFALFLGMWAGYFRGIVDDGIQYIYTTLSSVPGVLLIAAMMLALQTKIEADPDVRLLILCIILGITSWTSLCRLLRGETLKLREAEFVQAAVGLGVARLKIVVRHIMPNLAHIVFITVVLDFSGLVLAEAVLSYIGVGVDPASYSFGNMINASRLEMAREPVVWWSLLAALILMFALVFSANVFSDAVQEALDPRAV